MWLALAAGVWVGGWWGLLAWLDYTPRNLPMDWQGLWAADRRDHPGIVLAAESWSQPLGKIGIGHPGSPLTQEVNPAYRLRPGDGIFLGRWAPSDAFRWTMSLWVRTGDGTNGLGFTPLAGGMMRGLNLPWCWGTSNGLASFRLCKTEGVTHLVTTNSLPPGEWIHLTAVCAVPELRLYVNGRLSATKVGGQLTRLAREVWIGGPPESKRQRPEIAVDDFAVFGRALSPAEVASWYEAGRGAPINYLDRAGWRRRLVQVGTPLVAGVSMLFLLLSAVPWLRHHVFGALKEIMTPPLRAVRLTLLVGGLATVAVSGVVLREGRSADQLHLQLMARSACDGIEGYLGQVADFLMRARDFVAAHPEVTPVQFKDWLSQAHFPHDHPGLYSVGIALRVEEPELVEFEKRWSTRYPEGYVVLPRVPDEDRRPWRNWPSPPRLPVVINVVNDWGIASNGDHTLLGQDLLALRSHEEDVGGQFQSLQQIATRPAIRSCGLVEISGKEFGGTARQGIRLFAPLFRVPPNGKAAQGPRDWFGVVFASVDLREWMHSQSAGQAALTGVQLITGTEGQGYPIKEAVVVDSETLFPESARPLWPYLEYETKVKVYSRRIWARFWTTPAFERQSHRWWPWITATGGAIATVLTAGLLAVQIRARLHQETVAVELQSALDRLTAAREERERLSHDLHDGAIQSLYALQLGLSRAGEQAGIALPALGDRLNEYRRNLTAVIGELRGFILRHETEEGRGGDLASVLEALIERLRGATEIVLRADLSPEAARLLSDEQAVHLANLAREAISNALRHAHAQKITVTLEQEPGNVLLEIHDDGSGFDPARPPHTGLGLVSMSTRARQLGGTLQIESRLGNGTRVRIVVPVSGGKPVED